MAEYRNSCLWSVNGTGLKLPVTAHRSLRQPRILLGLVGPSGSGKSTVCRYFEEHYDFITIHAVEHLKRAFALLFGGPLSFCERPLADEPAYQGGPSRRAIMEHVGDAIHELAPGLLPSLLDKKLTKLARHPRILVDGIRRPTEAVTIRLHGGQIIRMIHPIDESKPCDIAQQAVIANYTLERSSLDIQLAELAKHLIPGE